MNQADAVRCVNDRLSQIRQEEFFIVVCAWFVSDTKIASLMLRKQSGLYGMATWEPSHYGWRTRPGYKWHESVEPAMAEYMGEVSRWTQ